MSERRNRFLGGAFLGAVVAAAACAGTPHAESTMSLVGRTIVIRYESGLAVKAHYGSASELIWEALAGPSKGEKGTEATHVVEVAPGVFFVSWLEKKDGVSVSNVVDLPQRRVWAYVTFGAEKGRQELFDKGTFEEAASEH